MTITKSKVKKKHTISSNYGITHMFIEEHHFEFCEIVIAVMFVFSGKVNVLTVLFNKQCRGYRNTSNNALVVIQTRRYNPLHVCHNVNFT